MPRPASSPRSRTRAHLLLVLTAMIWGFAFVPQRLGADTMGPFAFNGVRFALGGLSLLPVIVLVERLAARSGEAPAPAHANGWRPTLAPGALAGTVLAAASAIQQAGMSETGAGKAGFLTGLYIVIVPLLGALLGRRAPASVWFGIGLTVPGLYLLSVTADWQIARTDALMIVSALFWALHILILDAWSHRVDPLRLSVVQFAVCSGISLLIALVVEPAPFAGVPATVWSLLYAGMVSVGVAYTLQVVSQRDAEPGVAAMLMSLEALFAVIGGALLLGETMTLRGYLGCGLMLAGILVAQLPDRRPGAPTSADPTGDPRQQAADEDERDEDRPVPLPEPPATHH